MAFIHHHHHLIFLLTLLPLLALGGRCPASDSSSLIAFKHALSDPYGHLVSWSAADCCLWIHVSCNAAGVASLRLAGLNLSWSNNDALAPLARLANLISLDLSNNNFVFLPIPAGIFHHLPRLTHLNLSKSGFRGRVPLDLGTARMLVSLDLSEFSSWGGLWVEDASFLANLPELEELYLDGVNLSMAFPGKSCRALSSWLPKLRAVSLKDCSLVNCSLETMLKNLTSITHLGLDGNDFSPYPIPSFLSDFRSLSVLRLANCGLVGEFPVAVFQMKRLRILDVSGNPGLSGKLIEFPKGSFLEELVLYDTNFTGELPASVGNLAHLTTLDLSYAELSGKLPEEIKKMVGLTYLRLSSNNFTGRIPSLVELKQLSYVDLSSNSFQGFIDGVADNLPRLEALILENNSLSGSIPTSLFALPSLQYLALNRNYLSGELRDLDVIGTTELLQNQTILSYLDLSENRISGDIPSWMWKFESLRYLDLSSNNLTGLQQYDRSSTFPPILDVHSNQLQGMLVPLPLNKTFILDMSDNRFHSTISEVIGTNLSSSTFVALSGNNLFGSIPSSICEAPILQALDMSENNLTGSIPPCLAKKMSSSLRIVDLHTNSISGAIPDAFRIGCYLRTLDLNGNKIAGQIPTSLKNCKVLEVLNLGNNNIDGPFPSWLGTMPNLQVLVLHSNRLQGRLEPASLGGFRKLKIIDLSSNNFSGNLCSSCFNSWKSMKVSENEPSDNYAGFVVPFRFIVGGAIFLEKVTLTLKGYERKLGKIFTGLVTIDLSKNNFEGLIPETIGNLSLLCYLNLSHNALSKSIPRTIGHLSQVESLDLSWNKLTGEIPPEIVHLRFLSLLNLSSNQLVGKIPQGQQLDTFTKSSYQDNAGLCGHPLPNSCELDDESQIIHHPSEYAASSNCHNLNDRTWIAAEIGFIFGFGVIWLPLVFCRRWWIFYFNHIDSVLRAAPFCRLVLSHD